jgi:omega-6 fatty acid desaturase (delta-12 desaturase)
MRHPAFFFSMSPLFLWYFRFRLPFELPGFASTLRPSNKMLSLALLIIRFMLASRYGILGLVWAGDWAAMTIGLLLFHWQHVYESGHVVQSSKDWNMFDAALKGSSFIHVHPLLKFFTLGIECHHIHHMNSRIPGYLLGACHDEAPKGLWDELGVQKLYFQDLWSSLFLTLWDTDTGKFVRFPN